MNESAFEQRLRRGLAGAAEALPDQGAPQPEPVRPGGPGRRPFLAVAAAAVAVLSSVAVVTLLNARSEGKAAVTASEGERDAPGGGAPSNGQMPGQAVLVDQEIRLFDPAGGLVGSETIEPLLDASGGASSDLDSGWVVCGLAGDGESDRPTTGRDVLATTERDEAAAGVGTDPLPGAEVAPESPGANPEPFVEADEDLGPDVTTTGREESLVEQVYWYPEGGEPERLVGITPCYDLQVIDSAEGPIAVHSTEPAEPDEWATPVLEATVLATGETYEIPVDLPPEAFMTWSVATDRVLFPDDRGLLEMHDLDTGGQLDLPEIHVSEWADLALAPDGKSVAVADGSPDEATVSLAVYDLETGGVLFESDYDRRSTGQLYDISHEISFDGTKLAVGGHYPGGNPVEVIDIESGERHSLDASGLPL